MGLLLCPQTRRPHRRRGVRVGNPDGDGHHPNETEVDPTPYIPSPFPNDVIYAASEPSVTVPFIYTDPETGETFEGELFNDEISVRFSPEATEEDIDTILTAAALVLS